MKLSRIISGAVVSLGLVCGSAVAGPIFLTGHDPDFHSQDNAGAQNLLRSALNFVTNGTYNDSNPANKFLWVESRIAPPNGHRIGENGLHTIGLNLGINYDRANAAELASVNFSDYTAIAIASSFGGLLTRAELDELIARKSDLETFINGGGGLFAAAECYPCGSSLLAGTTAPDLFGFLPVTVTSIGANGPFYPTAYGSAPPFNLTFNDLNSPTHNSFGLIGGLNVVDYDSANHATSLAGIVQVSGGGFTPSNPVPEPTSIALLGLGLIGLTAGRLSRKK